VEQRRGGTEKGREVLDSPCMFFVCPESETRQGNTTSISRYINIFFQTYLITSSLS
jgi:hypothetical protein